jgi:membrane protease YdiL (CAAX protease family)
MSLPKAQPVTGYSPVREALTLWGISFASIVAASLIAPGYAKLVATISFLYLPLFFARSRSDGAFGKQSWPARFWTFDYAEFGVTFRNWRLDLKLALLVFAIVAPLYLVAYLGYAEALTWLPASWATHLSPYMGKLDFHPRLPDQFGLWTVDQLLVVAVPEEFFYRGYLQSRLREAYPQGRTFLGARLGPAFFLTAVLFAIGHLSIFQVWRLAVFFPALLFGWLRERTGTVLGASLVHAGFNLYEMVLRASFFGGN